MARKLKHIAVRVALVYALAAGLWILLSDRTLEQFAATPEQFTRWAIVKGWAFVAVTAFLLWAVLHRELRRADSEAARREKTEADLRESEARFRLVVETINEVFWIRDAASGLFLYVSPGYERIWGRPADELFREPDAWAAAVVAEDRGRVEESLAAPVTAEGQEIEFRIVRPDGGIRWIHGRTFPVIEETGRVTRIVGIAQDVSSRKDLEQQFLRAQRLESIGTLAGGVAHDLNNILAPILMGSTMLKKEDSAPEDRQLIEMIETAAQRGAGIIRQLLTFSRGAEGKRVLLQTRHILKETLGILRETFPRDISVELVAPGDLWPVQADATLIHQTFMNLCVNARDAMPSGGRLTIEARNLHLEERHLEARHDVKPGPFIVVAFTDSGEGIPPENLERIFDPFFTTKAHGRGTGLGLATVLGIVKSHGGFIAVHSTPGHGSTFKVHLPAVPDSSVDSDTGPEGEMDAGRGELILVVDDEPDILQATRRVLERGNYRVVTADNGQAALGQFLAHRDAIRLVLTDIMMPVMDGVAFIRALRALQETLPVIATSGLNDPDKSAVLDSLGVHSTLVKPCAAQDLRRVVARCLGHNGGSPGGSENA